MIRIYVITNTVNGKMYVGQTGGKPNQRWKEHLRCANKGEQHPLYHAMRKYGRDKFQYDEIASFETKEEANNAEHLWIILTNAHTSRNGYVCTWGGDGRTGPNDELRWRRINSGRKASPKGPTNRHYKHEVRSDEIVRLYNSGLSLVKVSKEIGCHTELVRCRLRAEGILLRGRHSYKGYKRAKMSPESCRKMGLSRSGINNYKYRADLDNKIDEMVELYLSGSSGKDVAKVFGTSTGTVYNRLRKRGVKLRPSNNIKREQ